MIRLACLTLILFYSSFASAFAADSAVTADLPLQQLQPADALTTLRAIADARDLEVIDEHTVRVTDTAEAVDLARMVIEMAENPTDVAEEIPTRDLTDGSVIASVRLRHASVRDVSMSLRKEVGVARIAANTRLSTVVIRDTAAKVASALDVIRRMERPQG